MLFVYIWKHLLKVHYCVFTFLLWNVNRKQSICKFVCLQWLVITLIFVIMLLYLLKEIGHFIFYVMDKADIQPCCCYSHFTGFSMLGKFTFCRVIRRFRCYFYLQIYILCILYGMHGSLLSTSCVRNYCNPCIISVNVIFYAFSLVVHRHMLSSWCVVARRSTY